VVHSPNGADHRVMDILNPDFIENLRQTKKLGMSSSSHNCGVRKLRSKKPAKNLYLAKSVTAACDTFLKDRKLK
jgi:hypothetical protein